MIVMNVPSEGHVRIGRVLRIVFLAAVQDVPMHDNHAKVQRITAQIAHNELPNRYDFRRAWALHNFTHPELHTSIRIMRREDATSLQRHITAISH